MSCLIDCMCSVFGGGGFLGGGWGFFSTQFDCLKL